MAGAAEWAHRKVVTSNIWVKMLFASNLAASSRRSAASTIWDTTLSSSCSPRELLVLRLRVLRSTTAHLSLDLGQVARWQSSDLEPSLRMLSHIRSCKLDSSGQQRLIIAACTISCSLTMRLLRTSACTANMPRIHYQVRLTCHTITLQ